VWCGNHRFAKYRLHNPRQLRGLHTFRRLQALVETAGVKTGHWPNIDYARMDASDDLKALGLKKYVVLVPGSSARGHYKRWPHYADLAKKLQMMGHNCLLLGGPDEVDLLSSLAAQTGAPALHQNPLSQVIDILAKAEFVVGNDTGMLHMAAAVGTKCVTIFGGAGSPPGKSAPTGKNAKVVYNSHIGAISSNEVLKNLGLA
jgi:ADP-heptose:LPS heptosyltransferase